MDDSSNCPSYEEAHSGPVRPEEDLVAGYLELVPERRGSHAQPAPGRPEKAEFKIFERPYNLDQNLFELCLNLLFTFGFLGEFNVFFSIPAIPVSVVVEAPEAGPGHLDE